MVRVSYRGLPGPRVWLFGRRCHHGLVASALLIGALATGHPAVAVGALAVMAHDWRDCPWMPSPEKPR